jgi:hypothetical protein
VLDPQRTPAEVTAQILAAHHGGVLSEGCYRNEHWGVRMSGPEGATGQCRVGGAAFLVEWCRQGSGASMRLTGITDPNRVWSRELVIAYGQTCRARLARVHGVGFRTSDDPTPLVLCDDDPAPCLLWPTEWQTNDGQPGRGFIAYGWRGKLLCVVEAQVVGENAADELAALRASLLSLTIAR